MRRLWLVVLVSACSPMMPHVERHCVVSHSETYPTITFELDPMTMQQRQTTTIATRYDCDSTALFHRPSGREFAHSRRAY